MLISRRRIALASLLLLVLAYIASFASVVIASRQDQRRLCDAIVVLGAAQYNGRPSPVLRARLDHALALYNEGLAPQIVVTGGIGEGDRVSEATVGQQYLVAHRVPRSAVIVRPEGRSTQASITAVAAWAAEHRVRRVLLVSDPFHMLRLRFEASRTRLTAWTSPTTTSPISHSWRLELPYFLAEAAKIPIVMLRL
ncbi:MAG: YdcF family protein [Gemmatimonadales bacterium]